MDYQLVVVRGAREGTPPLKLGEGITTVGRQEDCQIRINSSQVSRKHCQLFEKKGLLLVKDLKSSNGTFVNGQKVDDQRVLQPGDVLTIGQMQFRVEKAGAPVAAPAAAPAAKPGDTAIAEAALGLDDAGEEEFEIEIDEEPAATAAPPATGTQAKPEPEPQPAEAGIGEDAVADFLMNIDLDEDDKR